jgi:hypothetical protein
MMRYDNLTAKKVVLKVFLQMLLILALGDFWRQLPLVHTSRGKRLRLVAWHSEREENCRLRTAPVLREFVGFA